MGIENMYVLGLETYAFKILLNQSAFATTIEATIHVV